jgi:hypothetical protein
MSFWDFGRWTDTGQNMNTVNPPGCSSMSRAAYPKEKKPMRPFLLTWPDHFFVCVCMIPRARNESLLETSCLMKALSFGSLCCQSCAESSEKSQTASGGSLESADFLLPSRLSHLRPPKVIAVRFCIMTISISSSSDPFLLGLPLWERDRDLDLDLDWDALGDLERDLDKLGGGLLRPRRLWRYLFLLPALSLLCFATSEQLEGFFPEEVLLARVGLSFCRISWQGLSRSSKLGRGFPRATLVVRDFSIAQINRRRL